MAIHPNNLLLIQTLQSSAIFEGRFSNIRVVNCDLVSGQKRGVFSIVFRADDIVEGVPVAIKFFDVGVLADAYRLNAFKRESEILEQLGPSDRILRLVKPHSTFELPLTVAGVTAFSLPCPYFVVEWLPVEIDEFFLGRKASSALEKLHLFCNVVLAVEALHNRNVFHRDLKPDNIRMVRRAHKSVAVAIDLGTAARADSPPSATSYLQQVGAPAYAACEAICGMAANRSLAPFTDSYALGCLLFELFNKDLHYAVQHSMNPSLNSRYWAIAHEVASATDDKAKLERLHWGLSRFKPGIVPVPIDGPTSSCDAAVAPLLNDVLERLTKVDYRDRQVSLQWVRDRVGIAIHILKSEKLYQAKLKVNRQRRQNRLTRLRSRDERLRIGRLTDPSDAK